MSQETQETTVESTEIEEVQEQQKEVVVEKDLDSIIAQLQSEIEVLKAKVAPADAEEDDGSCAFEVDCAGECGGTAVVDCADECGGSAEED